MCNNFIVKYIFINFLFDFIFFYCCRVECLFNLFICFFFLMITYLLNFCLSGCVCMCFFLYFVCFCISVISFLPNEERVCVWHTCYNEMRIMLLLLWLLWQNVRKLHNLSIKMFVVFFFSCFNLLWLLLLLPLHLWFCISYEFLTILLF